MTQKCRPSENDVHSHDQNLFSAPFGCITAAWRRHHGPHTRHRWFWCCGVLLGKEPATSWCNKQHQGFQIEAEFFMDCFVFYQNVWRLFLFLNFCFTSEYKRVALDRTGTASDPVRSHRTTNTGSVCSRTRSNRLHTVQIFSVWFLVFISGETDKPVQVVTSRRLVLQVRTHLSRAELLSWVQ